MNYTTKLRRLGIAFLTAIVAFGTLSLPEAKAQDNPAPYELFGVPNYWLYYDFYGWIRHVRVLDKNDNDKRIIDNGPTGSDIYKLYKDPAYQIKIGGRYDVEEEGYYYYGNYVRVYIDLNADKDFFDIVSGENEFRGILYGYMDWQDPGYLWQYFRNINIPCTTPQAMSRIRVIHSYVYSLDPREFGWDYTIYGPQYGWYLFGEVEDYDIEFVPDAPNSFPAAEDMLYVNEWYNGTTRLKDGKNVDFTKPSLLFRAPQPAGTTVKMSINGPLPSTEVVWQALDRVTGSTTITNDIANQTTYTARRATGSFASADGNFRGTRGGEYRLSIEVGGAGCPGAVNRLFILSFDHDMAAREVIEPRTNGFPRFWKYKVGTPVQVEGLFQNVGLNEVRKFTAIAEISLANGTRLPDVVVEYDADQNPEQRVLQPGDRQSIKFGQIRYNEVGEYCIRIRAEFEGDMEPFNDQFPRQGDPCMVFEYQYDIQLQAHEIIKPFENEIIVANRPFRPTAVFRNVGISDASNVDTKIEFFFEGSQSAEVTLPEQVDDVPQGRFNTKAVSYQQTRLKNIGRYTAKITISHPDDEVKSDDIYQHDFFVESGISGRFTVGQLNEKDFNGQWKEDRNFATIQEAMDAVYLNGLSGSVTFELTDAEYIQESPRAGTPAWDFSSRIIGLGFDADLNKINTMTWTTAQNRKDAVTVRLKTSNGVGVYFGQNNLPSNLNSPFYLFNNFPDANFSGYITFDGKSQNSMKLVLDEITSSNVVSGSVFHLAKGTHNVTIKNVNIDNAVERIKNNVQLPTVVVRGTEFEFDREETRYLVNPNNTAGPVELRGYSAGIINRASIYTTVLGLQDNDPVASRLDTIPNTNNVFENNTISNFAYGVATLGIGQLIVQSEGRHRSFLNKGTVIRNNKISNISHAGIFAGFEDGAKIEGNRIYNVGNGVVPAYGIAAGGGTTYRARGYHNLNLTIDGNEISGLNSPVNTTGIRVEQVQISYTTASTPVRFPAVDERTNIFNNVVWGVNITNANATIAGIHLLTERRSNSIADVATGFFTDYMTSNDKVYNNTVVINQPLTRSNWATVGIGIQNAAGARVANNAVAILDAGDVGIYSAAFLYQGTAPFNGRNWADNSHIKGNPLVNKGLLMDRNVYWLGSANSNNAGASLYRIIETDNSGNILSAGSEDEFRNIEQMQAWFGSDENSYYGNFVDDMTLTTTNPQNYVIRSNPAPLGSLLSNRGMRIADTKHDINGILRGSVGDRYDIGAHEFNGRQHVVDLQPVSVMEPRSYQAFVGEFSDAQYIMTEAPVNVVSNIRNNGNLQQSGSRVMLDIYVQGTDGNFGTTPILSKEMTVDIASNENQHLDFMLANGDNDDWYPKTYAELNRELARSGAARYTVPARFNTMSANVTPVYRVKISVDSDQNNGNNIIEKDLRFYLKRSELNMMISGTHTNVNAQNSMNTNEVVSKLNFDAVWKGIEQMGWKHQFTTVSGVDTTWRYNFDLMDRSGWEPRAMNYNNYTTMLWADEFNTNISRTERLAVESFLEASNQFVKHNLIIASEELANNLGAMSQFRLHGLRAAHLSNDAHGNGLTYKNGTLEGVNIARGRTNTIIRPTYYDFLNDQNVEYGADVDPRPAVLEVINQNFDGSLLPGIAREGIIYTNTADQINGKVMAVVGSTLLTNTVYFGVDWRNFHDIETVLRGVVDYLNANGSDVIPVELTDFEAKAVNKSVSITWSTASEVNSSRFEVERSVVENEATGDFGRVAEMAAAGHSVTTRHYGPVVDNNVDYGKTYAYRLRSIDRSGEYSLSDTRLVTLTGLNGVLTMGQARPNPATSESHISFSVSESNVVNISLYDMNGQLVSTTEQSYSAGEHQFELPITNLSSGAYTIMLRSGDAVLSGSVSVVK